MSKKTTMPSIMPKVVINPGVNNPHTKYLEKPKVPTNQSVTMPSAPIRPGK